MTRSTKVVSETDLSSASTVHKSIKKAAKAKKQLPMKKENKKNSLKKRIKKRKKLFASFGL